MRLVIDGQRLGTERTGVGRCLESLLTTWAGEGWPLDDVLLVVREPLREGFDPGCPVRLVARGWPGLAVGGVRDSAGVLRRDDVLLAPANLVPRVWGGKTVLILYDTLLWSVPESFPRTRSGGGSAGGTGRRRRRAGRVVVPSEATAADVARHLGVPRDRVRVAYPGPEPGFRPARRR